MSKHDRAYREKQERNLVYALKYLTLTCENCKHKSSKRGKCRICGGRMKQKGQR